MPAVSTTGITELLNAWTNGDSSALEKLAPLILPDLHRIAKHHLDREHSGRIALLWRPQCQRSGRGSPCGAEYGLARLEARKGVAVARDKGDKGP